MSNRRSSLRLMALALSLVGVLGGAFAAGRSTVAPPGAPNPVRLEHGTPLGVVQSPAGALAAADNYVAVGITASLDPGQLRAFASQVIDPGTRASFVSAGQSLAQAGGPPPGARVIGAVVAHRLDRYGSGTASVSEWAVGSYWDGGAVPTQYWSLVDLSLRWSGGRWQLSLLREMAPGPVPDLVGGDRKGRSSGAWDQALTGMTVPFYGDS
jgi:hypothetical protein